MHLLDKTVLSRVLNSSLYVLLSLGSTCGCMKIPWVSNVCTSGVGITAESTDVGAVLGRVVEVSVSAAIEPVVEEEDPDESESADPDDSGPKRL